MPTNPTIEALPQPILTLDTRPPIESDWPYIVKTWLLSAGKSGEGQSAKDRRNRRYNTLKARGAQFIIACDPQNSDLILGWLCFEDFSSRHDCCTLLHYVYTKLRYRRQGVMRSMLAAAGFGPHRKILCSHWSADIDAVSKKLPCFIPVLP